MNPLFDLTGRVAIITGGAGLLGERYANALAAQGAHVVIADLQERAALLLAAKLKRDHGHPALGIRVDITREADVQRLCKRVLAWGKRIDVLINNAAIDAKVKGAGWGHLSRLENFSKTQWDRELAVGLTGAFLCAKTIGSHMAEVGKGVILNIASDLSVIAPDQRLYRKQGLSAANQSVKPVSYSVIKTGIVGLTRYLATYWADQGVRVNTLSPGGVKAGQPNDFVRRITRLIPLGRMARPTDYDAAVLFLCSDASSYMTGQNIVIDGGRSVW